METNGQAIAALERVLLTVEAELTALHTGKDVDRLDLGSRLRTDLTTPAVPVAPVAEQLPPPPPAAALPTTQPPPAPRPTPAPWRTPAPRPAPASPITVERVFRVAGVSLVVLAAVFFVSTAISRGWIGPTAQLALATSASLAMIAQSFRFSDDYDVWRPTMAIGGAASLFVTGVVGHFGLDLIGFTPTLVWLAVAVLSFLFLGRAHESEPVAAAGAFAALAGTGLFWASQDASSPVLFGFGALWALSVLVATWDQRWFGARVLGAAAGAAIVLMGAIVATGSGAIELIGVAVGIIGVAALAGAQMREFASAANDGALTLLAKIEARVSATVTPWATLVAAMVFAENLNGFDEYAGWFAIAVGALVTGIATASASRTHPTMTMLHQLAGIGTATVGMVGVLDGPVLIAAILGQAAVTSIFARRSQAPEMMFGAAGLASVPALWTLVQIVRALTTGTLTIGEIVVSGLVVAGVVAMTRMLSERPEFKNVWMGGWGLYLVWIVAALQGAPQTQVAISMAWAVSAVVLILMRSHIWNNAPTGQLRSVLNVGLATLALTGSKLVFVDLVAVDVLWRAALFFAIGGTYLRLAFVLPKMFEDEAENLEVAQPVEEAV